MKYKELIKNIDKNKLENYYSNHLPSECMKEFNIPSNYILNRILDEFKIKKHSASENTSIQMKNMSNEIRKERSNKISTSNTGRQVSEETRRKISEAEKGKKHNFKSQETYLKSCATRWYKGQRAHNKGISGVVKQSKETIVKRFNTMKENNSYNKSKEEEKYYEYLLSIYSSDDIVRQYYDRDRYPFHCDFYIKSEDLFIEFNRHWTHGEHQFNPNDNNDKIKLNEWKEKAKTSKFYKNAIYTWTELDMKKFSYARKNNLNFKAIY